MEEVLQISITENFEMSSTAVASTNACLSGALEMELVAFEVTEEIVVTELVTSSEKLYFSEGFAAVE